jgi:hypothetical protein
MTLTACVCLLAGDLQAMDLSARPCSAWNTARKANLSSVVQREWVFGYLSGLSDAAQNQSGQHMYAALPANEAIVAHIHQHCEQQPDSSVDAAAREVFERSRNSQ